MNIAMLGSGFIARFYADSLQAQRAKDSLISVYSMEYRQGQKSLLKIISSPFFRTIWTRW